MTTSSMTSYALRLHGRDDHAPLLRYRAVARSFSWVGMARRRRPTCVVQSEGLSFTTKSTNFHEWGAASLEIFGFGFIRVDS